MMRMTRAEMAKKEKLRKQQKRNRRLRKKKSQQKHLSLSNRKAKSWLRTLSKMTTS